MKTSSLAICACVLVISASAFAATTTTTTTPATQAVVQQELTNTPIRHDMTNYTLPSTEGYAINKQLAVGDMVFSPDTKPILINNTVLVPARAVADALGYTTTWNPGDTPSVTIESKDMTTTLTLGVDLSTASSTIAIGTTAPISYGAPAVLVGNTAYVPLGVFRVIQGNSPDAITVTDTGITIKNV